MTDTHILLSILDELRTLTSITVNAVKAANDVHSLLIRSESEKLGVEADVIFEAYDEAIQSILMEK